MAIPEAAHDTSPAGGHRRPYRPEMSDAGLRPAYEVEAVDEFGQRRSGFIAGERALTSFVEQLRGDAPPTARVVELRQSSIDERVAAGFVIERSHGSRTTCRDTNRTSSASSTAAPRSRRLIRAGRSPS